MSHSQHHIHFVTGRLAEHAVRTIVTQLARELDFRFSIGVLPITVAALMTPKWLLRHLTIPDQATRVILPGHLQDDIEILRAGVPLRLECGPRDIRDLPMFFGEKHSTDADRSDYSIEIIAEINHAPKLAMSELVHAAQTLQRDGADMIDLGCTPGYQWLQVGDAVRRLKAAGLRVSIDSFDVREVREACDAGAELVLSVNSSNREQALDWGQEVVVIPDTPGDKKSFQETHFFLRERRIATRLDPILEPIGCGFADSVNRYYECRRAFPDAKMMMGIGNLTELTDADSAGINVLLLGLCQELRIDSILTTQVINWSRSSVKECDLARRLVHYACKQRIPPKHIEPKLVLLRDERVNEFDLDTLAGLARSIRDKNVRIFTLEGQIHAVSANVHVHDGDPFSVMQQLLASEIGNSLDPSHAFYLGFEMAKALTANTLSKQYEQDQALDWGYLTRDEQHHRLPRDRN